MRFALLAVSLLACKSPAQVACEKKGGEWKQVRCKLAGDGTVHTCEHECVVPVFAPVDGPAPDGTFLLTPNP